MAQYVHPDYNGGTDAQDDIALVFSLKGWEPFDGVDHGRRRVDGVYQLLGRSITTLAYGPFSSASCSVYGQLRLGSFDFDWVGSKHWIADADNDYRICDGDSGGINRLWDFWDLQVSLVANFEGPGCCAHSGWKQRFTRLDAKIPWIESITGLNCSLQSTPQVSALYRVCRI